MRKKNSGGRRLTKKYNFVFRIVNYFSDVGYVGVHFYRRFPEMNFQNICEYPLITEIIDPHCHIQNIELLTWKTHGYPIVKRLYRAGRSSTQPHTPTIRIPGSRSQYYSVSQQSAVYQLSYDCKRIVDSRKRGTQ